MVKQKRQYFLHINVKFTKVLIFTIFDWSETIYGTVIFKTSGLNALHYYEMRRTLNIIIFLEKE